MNCLISEDTRRALRGDIAKTILDNIKSNTPTTIESLAKEYHSFFLKNTNNPEMAVDAARLVPLMVNQIFVVRPDIKKNARAIGLNSVKVEELNIEFEELDNVKKFLGLHITEKDKLNQAQQIANQKVVPTEQVNQLEQTENIIKVQEGLTPQSYGIGVLSIDPKSPNFLIEDPFQIHNLNARKVVLEAMAAAGVSSSANLKNFQGIKGGVYTRLITERAALKFYPDVALTANEIKFQHNRTNDVILVLTDKVGRPIKFDKEGKVNPQGQTVSFKVLSDPHRDRKGNVVTDPSEIRALVKAGKLHKSEGERLAAMAQVAKTTKESILALFSPINPDLSEERKAEIKAEREDYAISAINDLYNNLNKSREYLKQNINNYIVNSIVGGNDGFINKNSIEFNSLNNIKFPEGTYFNPQILTEEQVSGSIFDQGAIIFKYPGINNPIRVFLPAMISKPGIMNNIIDLFTKPLYESVAGELVPMSLKERKELLNQYSSPAISQIEFVGVSGDKVRLKVDTRLFEFKLNEEYPLEAVEAIKQVFNKREIYYNEEGLPDYHIPYGAIETLAKANGKEAKDYISTTLETTQPNQLFAEEINGKMYYARVTFPGLAVNNKYLLDNKPYTEISVEEQNGKAVVTRSENGRYKDYIFNNFIIQEIPDANGKIKAVNPTVSFAPLASEINKYKPKTIPLPVKDETLHSDYKGKVIFATPGSGKTTFAQEHAEVVDADDLIMMEVFNEEKYGDFKSFLESYASERKLDMDTLDPMYYVGGFMKYAKEKDFGDRNIVAEMYQAIRDQVPALKAEGKSLVIGSKRLIDIADIVFIQENEKLLANENYNKTGEEIEEAKKQGKPVIKINGYVDKIFSKPLSEASSVKEEEVITPKQENPDVTQSGQADLESFFLQKNAEMQGQEQLASEEQRQQAKTWYDKHPLSKYFSFDVVYNAVNTTRGPAAQWSLDGITLFTALNTSPDYSNLYHEAWHGFTQTFLTKEQRTELYNETRNKTGSFVDYNGEHVTFAKATDLQLEEYLAEDFRKYMLDGAKPVKGSPVRNQIFRAIMNALNWLFKNVGLKEIVFNPTSANKVQEIYEKLSKGDISFYNFDINNRDKTIGVLYKNNVVITRTDNPKKILNFQDSRLLLESMNSIISEYADKKNFGASKQGIEVKAYSTSLFKTKETALETYQYVNKEFIRLRNQHIKSLEIAKEEDKSLIQSKIDLLNYAISEFGDIKELKGNADGKGLIAYHMQQAEYIDAEDRNTYLDDIDETKTSEKGNQYDKKGNELSGQQLASQELRNLMQSIREYRGDKLVLNRLDVGKLVPEHKMWAKVHRILRGATDKPAMYQKLLDASVTDPSIKDLTNKLGSYITPHLISNNLWTNFWSIMSMPSVKLSHLTLEVVDTKDNEGNVISTKHKVTVGSSGTVSKTIINKWSQDFKLKSTTFIIKNPITNNNELNLKKIVDTFGENGKLKSDKVYEFLQAIGVTLTNTPEIKQEITSIKNPKGKPAYIFNRIKTLVNRNILQVKDLKEIFTNYPGSKEENLAPISNDIHLLNQLAELEMRNTDVTHNYGVTNAAGDVQFERTLPSTLTILINDLNKVTSLLELSKTPHLAHLNPVTNPFTRNSEWFKTLFDVNGWVNRTSQGLKNSDLSLSVENLSGLEVRKEGETEGISLAKADPLSKIISDFHLFTLGDKFELMRHADKSTSYSVFIQGLTKGSAYVDSLSFADGSGFRKTYDIVINYIQAELERINKLKELSKQKDIVYDPLYLEQGVKFVMFESILTPVVKEELLKLKPGTNLKSQTNLKGAIEKDLKNYFEKQITDVNKMLTKNNQVQFFDNDLIAETFKTLKNTDSTITIPQAKNTLVSSFVINSWIHNVESANVLYGDIALYKMAKEEFHKRNAGISSTGRAMASDKSTIDYANSKGKSYAKYKGIQTEEDYLNVDGSYNSAILEDSETISKYLPQIAKGLITSESKRIKDPVEVQKKVFGYDEKTNNVGDINKVYKNGMLHPYTKMTEGDAQGWITFDFYRSLSILEGQWSPEQNSLFEKIVNGESVDNDLVLQFFPTKKFQYWGPLQVEEGQLPLNAFHKFSLFPLIPNVIEGTNLQNLHTKMMQENVGYALFKSGSKISTLTKIKDGKAVPDKLYKGNGQSHEFDTSQGEYTKNKVYVQYLKDQLDIAPKFKSKVTFPTQMRKLIENGLFENGIPIDFDLKIEDENERVTAWENLGLATKEEYYILSGRGTVGQLESEQKTKAIYNKRETARKAASKYYGLIKQYETNIHSLVELKKKELKRKADIKYDSDGNIIVTKQLLEFMVGELDRQDMAAHELAFIETASNTLAHDLSISLSAEKLEKILTSIVVNKLVKQKFKGEGLIQISGVGFEKDVTLRGKLSPEEQSRYGTNDLPFYEYVENGPTKAMKVKIAMQGDFKNLLQLKDLEGNKIGTIEKLNQLLKQDAWLDKDDNRKLVTIVGPRIPTQENNSMEFAEVYEFLPTAAGNIVVLPSEIVAKAGSDFDIDKLTFMFKHIFYSEKEDKVFTPMDKNSEQGLANNIIDNMHEILSLPELYSNLVKPNSNDILEPIASDLADRRKYKPKVRENGEATTKVIPGNRVFELEYNAYKHVSNNVGKQVLGQAAIGNTYNSIFNRIGARFNKTYEEGKETYDVTLLLPHNKIKDSISLSHLYDVNGKNSIASIIAQLINGSVDVAKDAWLFDIQGDEKTMPILELLVEAGVDIEQAIYLVSHPLVRTYIDELNIVDSTFASALNKAPIGNLSAKITAKNNILNKYFGIAEKDVKKYPKELSKLTKQEDVKSFFESENLTTGLKDRIDTDLNNLDDVDKTILFQFLELEKYAEKLRNIKTNTNFDTKKSSTIFEAVNKQALYQFLNKENLFPDSMIRDVLKESPIGSFYIQDFQVDMLKGLFKLRNKKEINNFLIDKLKDPAWRKIIKEVTGWKKDDKVVSQFMNDLVSYIFQTSYHKFDINKTSYKGYPIKDTTNPFGVEIGKEGDETVIFVDKQQVKADYETLRSNKPLNKKLVQADGTILEPLEIGRYDKNNALIFPTFDSYYKYLVQREIIRHEYSGNNLEELKERLDYQDLYKTTAKTVNKEDLDRVVFERQIAAMALDTNLNMWKLFKSSTTMGHKFIDIIQKHPSLLESYDLIKDLSVDTLLKENSPKITNLVMLNKPDEYMLNLYHENLLYLSDYHNISLPDSVSKGEKKRVTDFFKQFSMYSFLQSGLNTSGKYSLTRIVPQEEFTKYMTEEMSNVLPKIDSAYLERYLDLFEKVNNKRNFRVRSRLKDYTDPAYNMTFYADEPVVITNDFEAADAAAKKEGGVLEQNFKDGSVYPITTEELFDATDKELKPGSVVSYNGERYIVWNIKEDDKVQLITNAGIKFSGTPNKDKVEVLGNYSTIQFEQKPYIITTKGNIYSLSTGDKVFATEASAKKRERILASAKFKTRTMQPQFEGKTSMKLIKSGDRTRTTRSASSMEKLRKAFGLPRIEALKDKVVKMTNKEGEVVYAKIKDLGLLTKEYQDATWQKEGWTKDTTDRLVDKAYWGVEFEVVNKPEEKIDKEEPDVILTIGTSGSGKSTWIKSLPKDQYTVISPDEMRIEFTGDINDKSKDKEIYEEVKRRTINALKQSEQIIIDSTNLQKNRRRDFIKAVKEAIPTANIQYKLMELNPELAKERIKKDLNLFDTSKPKINIYAGTNENAELSNFAVRPFEYNTKRFTRDTIKFQSVEQAFQFMKLEYSPSSVKNESVANKILETNNGKTLKSLGKSFELTKDGSWDRNSSKIMKELLKASFQQNPKALEKLLATGNATLTHTQDKSKWGTEFPKLLMEVRQELNTQQRANVPDSTIDRHTGLYKEMLNDIKEEDITEFKEEPDEPTACEGGLAV